MADRDLAFENVISGKSAEKRTALIVFPIVVVLVLLLGFAAVSISRSSALVTEVHNAQRELADAKKVVEERDGQLREARADVAVLSTPGQGVAVLAAVKGSGASGIARSHPERHTLAVFAWNLAPAPEGQQYRVVVADAERATLLGVLAPDERGAASLLARDVPEGAGRIEVALVRAPANPGAREAGPRPAPADRQPVLEGALPRPGEAGVVQAEPEAGRREQARAPAAARRRPAR